MSSESLRSIVAAIRAGERSVVEIAEHLIDQRRGWRSLNAFVDSDPAQLLDQALRLDARASDLRRLGGPWPTLFGVPVALKDNIVETEFQTRCASEILADFRSIFDAHAVEKLRGRGAWVFGKTNMDEFAMGSSGESSAMGATMNPWSSSVVPGGSSSGSAAAVAAGLVPAALGSDTGGSIRQPAAFCGVVGMKPTYGRVSRRGLVAYGSSLDQIGPIARSVEDAALLYDGIAGFDAGDSTSAERAVDDVNESLEAGCQGLRIGLPTEYFGDGLSVEVREAVTDVAKRLENAGATLVEIELPHTRYGVAAYYIIATAEASSNLARFDGVRYGRRAEGVEDIAELYAKSRAEGFGEEVKRRILLGTFVLSSGYYDAYYRRAQQVRRLVCRDFEHAFDRCDVLLTPTTPTPAFAFGRAAMDPIEVYLADGFTVPANLAGIPAISLPATLSADRLPIGVQFLTRAFDEATLFRVARAWEAVRGAFESPTPTDFHRGATA